MFSTRLTMGVLLFALAPALCGCGGEEFYPVSGVVNYSDDEPVPGGGALKFVGQGEESPIVEGEIQSDGKFSMSTMDDAGDWTPGVPPGKYDVYVVPLGTGETDEDTGETPEVVSEKFKDPTTSGILVAVERKDNTDLKIQVDRPLAGESGQ